MFISAVVLQVLPGHHRSGAGGPACKAGPCRATRTPSSPLCPEDRIGYGRTAQPLGNPRFHRTAGADLHGHPSRPPRYRGGALPALPAPPGAAAPALLKAGHRGVPRRAAGAGLGAAGRAGEFAAGIGWARAARSAEPALPWLLLALGLCLGRPWGGCAEPPRRLRPAASPRS